MVYLDGEVFASWVEAAVYLELKRQGKRFRHNQPYGGLGRARYDFYLIDENCYIEVTGYDRSVPWWSKYLRRIVRKKRYVENVLHGKFTFINRLCTKSERQELNQLVGKQQSRFILEA